MHAIKYPDDCNLIKRETILVALIKSGKSFKTWSRSQRFEVENLENEEQKAAEKSSQQ